jgi:hypothetical protein
MRKCLLLLIFCAYLSDVSNVEAQLIQQRPLPANGERGRLGDPQSLPLVKIGSRMLRLAPGGVIYDQANRSITHAGLPPAAHVLYTQDQNGDIQRLYVLTDDERMRLDEARRR